MNPWMSWLALVAEQAVLAIALLAVFEGCRRSARGGLTRSTAGLLAIALVLPVGDAWLNLNVVKSVRALQADKMAAIAQHGTEPAGGWEKAASSPAARAAMSDEAATMRYVFQGVRIDVIDANGVRAPFVPTPGQEQAHAQFLLDEKGAESSAQASWDRGIRLLVETAAFMIVGVALGLRARRRG